MRMLFGFGLLHDDKVDMARRMIAWFEGDMVQNNLLCFIFVMFPNERENGNCHVGPFEEKRGGREGGRRGRYCHF